MIKLIMTWEDGKESDDIFSDEKEARRIASTAIQLDGECTRGDGYTGKVNKIEIKVIE